MMLSTRDAEGNIHSYDYTDLAIAFFTMRRNAVKDEKQRLYYKIAIDAMTKQMDDSPAKAKGLDKATKVLKGEYDKALKNPTVHNPLAYALYHTWRAFDRKVK